MFVPKLAAAIVAVIVGLVAATPASRNYYTTAPTCRAEGEKCRGASGYPAVEWIECCEGSCHKPAGDWGFVCSSEYVAPTKYVEDKPKCCAEGEKCRGASGYPAVEWMKCCEGECDKPADDWGFICSTGYVEPTYTTVKPYQTTTEKVYTTQKPYKTTTEKVYTTQKPYYTTTPKPYETTTTENVYTTQKPYYTTTPKPYETTTTEKVYTTQKTYYTTTVKPYETTTTEKVYTTQKPYYTTTPKPYETTTTEKVYTTPMPYYTTTPKPYETTTTEKVYTTQKPYYTTTPKPYETTHTTFTTRFRACFGYMNIEWALNPASSANPDISEVSLDLYEPQNLSTPQFQFDRSPVEDLPCLDVGTYRLVWINRADTPADLIVGASTPSDSLDVTNIIVPAASMSGPGSSALEISTT